jgi:hypothetical protein
MLYKSKILILVLLILVLAPVCIYAENDFLIIPGQRIGDASVGATYTGMQTRLGKPDATREMGVYTLYAYRNTNIVVAISNNDDSVFTVMTIDPRYHLDNGLRVGSSAAEVAFKLGEPSDRSTLSNGSEQWFYINRGLIFQIDEDNVRAIGVVSTL